MYRVYSLSAMLKGCAVGSGTTEADARNASGLTLGVGGTAANWTQSELITSTSSVPCSWNHECHKALRRACTVLFLQHSVMLFIITNSYVVKSTLLSLGQTVAYSRSDQNADHGRHWSGLRKLPLKADSHIACRAHAVPLPCRAAKGLECVFPIWLTQCGVSDSHLRCHAPIMPFFSRPQHSTAVERRPVGYLLAFVFFRLPCRVPRVYYQTRTNIRCRWPVWNQTPFACTRKRVVAAHYKKDDLLHCWTSSSDISVYHADFNEGHGTVGAGQGRGMACGN